MFLETKKTNNTIESYHRWLRELFGHKQHPNAWHFIDKLNHLIDASTSDKIRLDNDLKIRRFNTSNQKEKKRQCSLEQKLLNGEISALHFIKAHAHSHKKNTIDNNSDSDYSDADVSEN